ncbi:MAG: TetR/AcrR family transcriptional regulator [Aureispira sp.]
MDSNKQSTEEKILAAAKKVFYQKGLKGARMQEIADDAGVNKAMLHYYFRSKQKLFDQVFSQSVRSITPQLMDVFLEESNLQTKIAHLVELTIDLFLEEPFLSNFIINELSNNPEKLFQSILEYDDGLVGKVLPLISSQIQEGIEQGSIQSDLKPAELIVNILSLCLLPIMAQTVLQRILGIDDERMERFMVKRKQTVTQFVLDAMKP